MRILPIGLLFIMTSAQASFLQICPASVPPSGGPEAVITGADGVQSRIRVDEVAAPGCRSMSLPVPAESIVALHPLGTPEAKRIGDRLIVEGIARDNSFSISTATFTAEHEEPGRRPMPLQENLLTGMAVRTFGVEERVQATLRNGQLDLRCAAGTRPAGVILSAPWYMTQARARLQLSATGNGRFEVAMADAAGATKESATTLGHVEGNAASAVDLALPPTGFDRTDWRHFSIACPRHQAALVLNDVRLVAHGPSPGTRSGWVWDAQDWMAEADRLLKQAQQYGLRTLFISVPVANGMIANPDALAAFVRHASALGIAVWSVDGDPRMVLPGEHAATVARARAYASYNKAVDPVARLRGMQFDIEHYLLPGYGTASGELDRHYLTLARALNRAAGEMPLEFVVPFWWNNKPVLLKGLAGAASGLNVMDYRTDPAQIRDFAVPFLDWGVNHGKKVRIAVEAGPVDTEQQRRYVKDTAGQAWLVTLDRMHVLLLLKDARPNLHGPTFRLASSTMLDGSATSFHKDPGRMLEVLPALESYFSAWPSFNGMALHGLQ
ncbi:hypothetical protein GCM10027343_24990 [Noviherbaspirillum agri]